MHHAVVSVGTAGVGGGMKKPGWCREVTKKGSAVLRGSVVSHKIRGSPGDKLNIKK